MSKYNGIDISKASFDVAIKQKNGKFKLFQLENNLKGFKKLIKQIDSESITVMEATGTYFLPLASFLHKNNYKVAVVNPLQIKHFVRMRMVRAKTDKKDALMIASYGESENPKIWKPKQEIIQQIAQLHTIVEGLTKQETAIKNQLEAFNQLIVNDKIGERTLLSLLKKIKEEKNKLENRMLELITKHYEETFLLLMSIPGIGKKTAMMLIVISDDFNKFDSAKQMAAYLGMSPRIYQSGTSVNGRGHISKMGNKYIRKLLYICSWSAKRYNKQSKLMSERLEKKGKPKKVINMALANKLLKQAFGVAKNRKKYDENYVNPKYKYI
jgi:transposase